MRYLANRSFRMKQPAQGAVAFEVGDEVTCFGELPEPVRHRLVSQSYVRLADGDLSFTEREVAELKEMLRLRRKMPAPLREGDGGEVEVEVKDLPDPKTAKPAKAEADAPLPDLTLPDHGISADFDMPDLASSPKKSSAKARK